MKKLLIALALFSLPVSATTDAEFKATNEESIAFMVAKSCNERSGDDKLNCKEVIEKYFRNFARRNYLKGYIDALEGK